MSQLNPIPPPDFDEGDPGFDQPASQEAAAAELRIAVAVFRLLRLAGDFERLDIGAEDQLLGLLIQLLMIGDGDFTAARGEVVFEVAEQTQPPFEPRRRDRDGHILRQLPGIRHEERIVIDPQKAGADEPFGPRPPPTDTTVGRSWSGGAISLAMAQPRLGCRTVPVGMIAGVHLVRGPSVLSLFVGHRPDQGDVVHLLGRLFPAFGDPNSGDGRLDGFGRSAVLRPRFGIKRFELAGPSLHPQQDQRHPLFSKLAGLDAHQVAEIERSRRQGPRRNVVQKIPPRHAAARQEMSR